MPRKSPYDTGVERKCNGDVRETGPQIYKVFGIDEQDELSETALFERRIKVIHGRPNALWEKLGL